MFENPRTGRQARNFTINVPKILDLKSSSEQIFSENWRWVPLSGWGNNKQRTKLKNEMHYDVYVLAFYTQTYAIAFWVHQIHHSFQRKSVMKHLWWQDGSRKWWAFPCHLPAQSAGGSEPLASARNGCVFRRLSWQSLTALQLACLALPFVTCWPRTLWGYRIYQLPSVLAIICLKILSYTDVKGFINTQYCFSPNNLHVVLIKIPQKLFHLV